MLVFPYSSTPKRKEDFNSGDILNGTGTMEYHNATKQVSVSFRNLQLKKIKRTEKKGTESVMDEKFSVLFWTEFTVRNPHSIELKVAFTHLTTMRVTKQSLKSRETYLVTMFYRKLQVFQKLGQMDHF